MRGETPTTADRGRDGRVGGAGPPTERQPAPAPPSLAEAAPLTPMPKRAATEPAPPRSAS